MRRNHKALSLAALLLLFGISYLVKAAQKPFWFDEILTLRVAQSPIGPEMWRAMTAGFDLNPPAIYVSTRLAEIAFGRGPVSSRLPSIVSAVFVLFCLFRVASRRGGTAAGFASMFFLSFCAYGYFLEARPYALVLAGTMLAWLSWQYRCDSSGRRPLPLLGIFTGLTLVITAHMWGIIVPACFVVSALARKWFRKIGDAGALAAMVIPYVFVLPTAPLVRAARGIHFGGDVYNIPIDVAYSEMFGNVQLILILSAAALLIGLLFFPTQPVIESPDGHAGLSPEDVVLALCLLGAPAFIFLGTKLTHSPFMSRYAIISILGLAFLASQAWSFLAQYARGAGYAWLFLLGLGLAASDLRAIRGIRPPTQDSVNPELSAISEIANNHDPIFYASGVAFLQADYYARPEVAARLGYVADRSLAIQIAGSDGVDAIYAKGRPWLHTRGRILTYPELKSSYHSFWLVDDPETSLNWLYEKLRADGAEIDALRIPKTRILHITQR